MELWLIDWGIGCYFCFVIQGQSSAQFEVRKDRKADFMRNVKYDIMHETIRMQICAGSVEECFFVGKLGWHIVFIYITECR